MTYKFPKKMTFNTRSLIALEDISREPLGQIMIKMAQGSFKSMIQLLAAGTGMDFDETMEFVDAEIEKGMTIENLNAAMEKDLQGSVFMKNPEVQKALKEAEKELKKEPKKA